MSVAPTRPTAPPPPSPARPYRFPPFESEVLSNGIRLVVAPVRKLPLVTLAAVADAGAVAEPAGQEGVAHLTAAALAEGTARRSGVELTAALEQLGASLDASANWDATVLTMTVLAGRFRAAMALFGEVLLEPVFPTRETDRLKAERLSEILQLRAEPRGLADEMFGRFVYVPTSRYALPERGDASAVSLLARSELEAFYGARYGAGATIVAVGDVEVADVARAVEETFAGWSAGTAPPGSTDDRAARGVRAVHVVEKRDAPQSELRIGHVGLPRSHPDYFAVLVMNAILGGLFNSRINLNLREARGYTYGASSSFGWRRGAGPFLVSTAVRSDVTDAAVVEVLREVERIRAEPVADDELSLATSYLAGVFPIRYETTAAIAQALVAMVVHGLPADYFDRYRASVAAVGIEDVRRAAESHLRPEELQVVAVGDPGAIQAPLEGLALGPLSVYDADGNAGRDNE